MSYTRTAIATTIIIASLAATAPGTRPETVSGGLAGSPQATARAISHSPDLQVPMVTVAPAPARVTTVHTETQEQRDTANWALEQMTAAGFELPPVTIYMHSDRADCSSDPNRVLNGYFVQIEGENIVHSCGNSWTLLHELTHVWDKNVLDDATRQQFLDHQGLDTWMSGTWQQAGGEHLASVVAWAIEGSHPTRIGYYDRDHLTEAYALMTGAVPPAMAPADSSTVSSPVASATVFETDTQTETQPAQ